MGFLTDYGKSQAGPQVQGLFRDVLGAGAFVKRAEAQDIENTKNQLQIEELQRQQKFLHTQRNIRESVLYLSLPEDHREKFVEHYIKSGYADKDGMTTEFKKRQYLGESKEGVDLYFEGLKIGAQTNLDKAFQALVKAQGTGDTDAIAKAEKGLQYATAYSASVNEKYGEVSKLIGGGEDELDNDLKEFEQVYPDMKPLRGSDEYRKQYSSFLQSKRAESQSPINLQMKDWESVHPNATTEERMKERERLMSLTSNIRAQAYGTVPVSSTPGVFFDKVKQKYMVNGPNGPVELNSEQVKHMGLTYGEQKVTNDLRVMQQSVPSVLHLVNGVRSSIQDEIRKLGPVASRWRELWAGKAGVSDPAFTRIRTNVHLLQTRLMKMHVGARGGEYILKEFQDLLDSGKQSPENMVAALDEIEAYANEVGMSVVPPIEDKRDVPSGLPEGTIDNGDGTFTLPNGKVIRKKQ